MRTDLNKSYPFLCCSDWSLTFLWPSSSGVGNTLLLSIKRFWGKLFRQYWLQHNQKTNVFKHSVGTLTPIASPSLRWNGAPSSDSAFLFFFFLETCWFWKSKTCIVFILEHQNQVQLFTFCFYPVWDFIPAQFLWLLFGQKQQVWGEAIMCCHASAQRARRGVMGCIPNQFLWRVKTPFSWNSHFDIQQHLLRTWK